MSQETFNVDRSSPLPILSYADSLARNPDALLLIGRLFVGALFVLSGVLKLTGVAAYSTRGWFFGPLGAGTELLGGLLIFAGFATRYACILMFAFMLVATFTAHRFWSFADAAQFRAQQSQFFKNASASRTAALHALAEHLPTWLLSGTPTPNGLIDCWSPGRIISAGGEFWQ